LITQGSQMSVALVDKLFPFFGRPDEHKPMNWEVPPDNMSSSYNFYLEDKAAAYWDQSNLVCLYIGNDRIWPNEYSNTNDCTGRIGIIDVGRGMTTVMTGRQCHIVFIRLSSSRCCGSHGILKCHLPFSMHFSVRQQIHDANTDGNAVESICYILSLVWQPLQNWYAYNSFHNVSHQ